jgi:DNA-binding NarL/FixJ family response regulator
MAIRVLLADDHTMVRQALRGLVEKDENMTVVAEAKDGSEVLALAKEFSPDVVVMDVGMPNMNGIESTKLLLADHPDIKVVALSAYADKRFILGMLQAGAVGYIIKAEAGGELLRAIQSVMDGESYISPQVSSTVVKSVRENGKAGKKSLGPRELEVLKLLTEGLTSSEIAPRLNIAPATVEVHRRNMMRKLGVHSIAELTKYAVREGLVTV